MWWLGTVPVVQRRKLVHCGANKEERGCRKEARVTQILVPFFCHFVSLLYWTSVQRSAWNLSGRSYQIPFSSRDRRQLIGSKQLW